MSRIIVVEDEPAIAELISINLRHAGHEVTIAATAEQAVATSSPWAIRSSTRSTGAEADIRP